MGAMMTTRRRDSGDISMCLTTNACFNARCPEASVWTVGMYTEPLWEGKGKHFSKEFEAFALTLCREIAGEKSL